jgi:hypothetical protein
MRRRLSLVLIACALSGCAQHEPARPPPPLPAPLPPAPVPPAPPKVYDALERATFNQLAVRLNLPLYWAADTNGNRAVDPDEVRSLLFYPSYTPWVRGGKLDGEFDLAYAAMLASIHARPGDLSPGEAARRALVLDELDQARPILIYTDARGYAPGEKTAVREILAASLEIDRIFAMQTGMTALEQQLPGDDPASRSLFRRNWGPKCLAPKTEKNPACSAIPGAPKPKVDVYPASIQADSKFCAGLEARKDAKELLAPFVVVREKDGELTTVKYSEAYAAPMQSVALHLERAAGALGADEQPFSDYLRAAAKAFRDNDWEGADEAWSKMSAESSKYYLRIGPDETYWEPCSQKAGFHVSFARINQGSLAWQAKLRPLQQEMEARLAKLAGWPYSARKVAFHLPDFIDIILNAGDSRDALGATIGQSLPNWGKVANESRGRTVVMSNLYTDPDSLEIRREQALSLLDNDTATVLSDDHTNTLLGTILHEATHNLGPAHEYKFQGKTDNLAFGGGLASMMEELKAQTGALYYLALLVEKGVISPALQRQVYLDNVIWSFSQVAQGMWTEEGKRKPYSQLAAIQLGFLMDQGAVVWDEAAPAANGKDRGAFKLVWDELPTACEKLMKQVVTIKARNDKAAAEALAKKYADGNRVPQSVISERVLRFQKSSFVYALDL